MLKSESGDDGGHKTESVLTRTFLNLEQIDPLIYRSTHLMKPNLSRAVFGGQVVGQALVAASNTVDEGREAHSLHCYFLRPGKIDNPILYQVLKMRDGMTYSNRFVRATQLGKPVFTMMVSFKQNEADMFSHQFEMPVVPPPEQLTEGTELLKQRLGNDDIGEREKRYIQQRLSEEITILVKPVNPETYLRQKNHPAQQCHWVKVAGHIGDNQQMQKCAAAYMSDSMLLSTALLPGAVNVRGRGKFFMTSIDHSIWFHHPLHADQWMLYEMESPICGNSRAFCHGRYWNRNGSLLLSVSQEGVLRTNFKAWESSHSGSIVDKGGNSSDVSVAGRSSAQLQQTRSFSSYTRKPQISTLKNVFSFVKRCIHSI